MILLLGGVLDDHEVDAMRDAASGIGFIDGRATAGVYAKGVKANEQATKSPALDAILAKVTAALDAHEVFAAAARPRHYVRLMLSRYRPGMEYGAHVDDAIMGGARTDMSFTLFLSEPESYDGGELVMEEEAEARAFRPAPGDAILYPTGVLHRVAPVTRGERLAVVGWVTSWVRDPQRREVLYDLDLAARDIFAAEGKTPAFDRLLKAKTNLFRMWAEG